MLLAVSPYGRTHRGFYKGQPVAVKVRHSLLAFTASSCLCQGAAWVPHLIGHNACHMVPPESSLACFRNCFPGTHYVEICTHPLCSIQAIKVKLEQQHLQGADAERHLQIVANGRRNVRHRDGQPLAIVFTEGLRESGVPLVRTLQYASHCARTRASKPEQVSARI